MEVTPEVCRQGGCQATRMHARGLCMNHYAQARRSGALPPKTRVRMDPIARILGWIEEDANGCWVARANLNAYGYARVELGDGRTVGAHRLMYEHHIGPVPDELVLDHLCRNRSCCNPWHLDPVTSRVNVLRGEGHSALNVAKTHCIRGHEFGGDNLRIDGARRRCRACHAERVRQYRARDKAVAK